MALDMYEHAYHMDFGSEASAWVDAFLANLNWDAVYRCYQHAVEAASASIGIEQGELTDDIEIVDVRRAGPFEQATHMLPRARWRDPSQVATWGEAVDPRQPVVVYCVYGHEVCRATAMRLRAQGRNARFLRGGIDAWHKAGLPLAAKPLQANAPG